MSEVLPASWLSKTRPVLGVGEPDGVQRRRAARGAAVGGLGRDVGPGDLRRGDAVVPRGLVRVVEGLVEGRPVGWLLPIDGSPASWARANDEGAPYWLKVGGVAVLGAGFAGTSVRVAVPVTDSPSGA